MSEAWELILTEVLIYHQRNDYGNCACGWSCFGASFAAHVVDVFKMELAELQPS